MSMLGKIIALFTLFGLLIAFLAVSSTLPTWFTTDQKTLLNSFVTIFIAMLMVYAATR